jgi:CRP-like cAMP-binding protein
LGWFDPAACERPMSNNAEPLVRRLDSIAALSEDERDAIRALPVRISESEADTDVVREGDRPSQACLLIEGFACISKTLRDGHRQIAAFQIAGDIPDLLSVHLKVLDCSVRLLTPCRLAYIQHKAIRDLCREFPNLAEALWRSTLIDGAIFREWIANIGQRAAPQRLAHLLCEFLTRMRAVGLAENHSCAFPVTQAELAEATGMTPVHVNRCLNQLRNAGLVTLEKQRLDVHNWRGLKAFADFDPGYLHLRVVEHPSQ